MVTSQPCLLWLYETLSPGGEVVLRDCWLSAVVHGCSAWGVLLWSDVIPPLSAPGYERTLFFVAHLKDFN